MGTAQRRKPLVGNGGDISLRLPKRGNAAIFLHVARAGVVSGQSKGNVAAKILQLLPIKACASAEVLFHIIRIDTQIPRCLRHQLRKPDRPSARLRTWIETALLINQRQELVFVDPLFTRDPADEVGDGGVGLRR